MIVAFYVVQIIISLTIIVFVLLQAKGSGLGSIFGGDGSVYRTKRGAEKLLHQATIALSVLFFVLSLSAVSINLYL